MISTFIIRSFFSIHLFVQIKSDQKKELQKIRQNINKCFPNIGGFLLPHPGKAVVKKQEYDGTVKGKCCTFCDLKAKIGRPLNDNFLFCGVIKQQINVNLIREKIHFF